MGRKTKKKKKEEKEKYTRERGKGGEIDERKGVRERDGLVLSRLVLPCFCLVSVRTRWGGAARRAETPVCPPLLFPELCCKRNGKIPVYAKPFLICTYLFSFVPTLAAQRAP